MCSRTLSDPANRLRKTRKKKSSAVPLFSKRSHVGNLRQTIQGKGVIHKRVETAGVYPLVRPRGVSALPPPRGAANPLAESQRITPARQGRTRLRSSHAPLSRCRKKTAARIGRTRLRQFACPTQPVQKNPCRIDKSNASY